MAGTGLWNDLRFAVRGLLRNPGFTLVAALTLALGIGANTAVFTVVDGVLLSPLPFDDSEELVRIGHLGRGGADELPMSAGLYLLYRERVRALDGIALHTGSSVNLAGEGDEPVRAAAQVVTPGFFDVLRLEPLLGRAFTEEEGAPGGESSIVLAEGLWRRAFGGDPDVLGRSVVVNGVSRTVVGVMPATVGYPLQPAELYVPLVIDPANAPTAAFSASSIARLAPDATVASLATELDGLIGSLGELLPGDPQAAFLGDVGLVSDVAALKSWVVGDVTETLWILLGTVGFVLLIACANVANLFLVRAEGRHREMALRLAIGASRSAVFRPFLAESAVLAAVGGAAGLSLASAAVLVAARLAPSDVPRLAEIGMDVRVLAFTAVVTLGASLFFGIFPLLRYGRSDLSSPLKEGGDRGGTGGVHRHRIRNTLVVAQVALALVLLVGSGLMLRSFLALRSVDPGFDVEGVMAVQLAVPPGEVPDAAEAQAFFEQLVERVRQQPGVVAAGTVQAVPLTGVQSFGTIEVEDHPRGEGELPILATLQRAGAGYFEAAGVDVIEGRALQPGDAGNAQRAMVVSESFAERWWPDASALGRRVRQGAFEDWYEIVGVVADVHQAGLEVPAEEMLYFPALWGPAEQPIATRQMELVVKVEAGDPLAVLDAVRREAQALGPRIPLSSPRTMQDVFDQATARASFTATLLGSAALVALALGLVGIYGVISYVVSQRTREIGVRMALGASGAAVRGMVVRQGAALAAIGVAVGLVAAVALSRLMGSLLFGVSALDVPTYAAVATALAAVALLASWIPAARAARVDPLEALRDG